MRQLLDTFKRWVFGEPIATGAIQPVFRSRVAVAVFGASILSAAVYAPDAVVDALGRGGQLSAIPYLVLGVVVVMVVLALAYRSNLMHRADSAADYGLVRDTLGPRASVVSGTALLVDYLFTVAVSVAAAAHLGTYVFPEGDGWQSLIAVAIIAIMTLASMRGVRERARVMVVTWVGFVLVIVAMAVVGGLRYTGSPETLNPELPSTWGIVVAFAAALASGAVMVTGIEHLVASSPHHEEPRAQRTGRTLLSATLVAAFTFATVMLLAWAYHVEGGDAGPIVLQVSDSIAGGHIAVWVVAIAGIAILYSAAAAVFKRFTGLAAALAKDYYLPRQLAMHNDRLVLRGGVLIVSFASAVLVLATNANVVQLVHMYVIGVFTSIVLSQVAMVRTLAERIRATASGPTRRRLVWRALLHGVAVAIAGVVWSVVASVNFLYGAWVALALMLWLVALMHAIHRHYDRVRLDMTITPGDRTGAMPSATHGVVLVAQLHRPALRAIAYARAARHTRLEAVGVQIDPEAARALHENWSSQNLGIPLVILDSPYRDIIGPVLDYVRTIHRESPRDVVVVYVPEYIVGTWWERLLHNRATVRLRSLLLRESGVVVAAVPWHLESAVAHDPTPDAS